MKTWFNITAVALPGANGGNKAMIDIHDEIGGWGVGAGDFMAELNAIDNVNEIELSVHSPGGSVLDGWAMYNALKNHKARVTARVEGLAASMASVIIMAADEIIVPENAYVMIHNASGMAWGEAEELRSMADLCDKLTVDIANVYVARSGLELSEISAMMDAETWMNGSDAVERGFADCVGKELKVAAVAGASKMLSNYQFANVPEGLKALERESEEEGFLAKIKGLLAGDNSGGDDQKIKAKQVKSLQAELSEAVGNITRLESELMASKDVVKALKAEQFEAWELISEAGFDADALKKLPASGGDEVPDNAYDKYKAIEDPAKRKEFFRANGAAIIAAKDKKNLG